MTAEYSVTTDYAIETRGLTRHFGKLIAVDHIDLQIPKAKIYGFLGPNGSGKSTTIRMLCGLLTPTAGTAQVLGHIIPGNAAALKQDIGYMTQRFSLYEDLNIRENLEFIADIYCLARRGRKQRINDQLARYNLIERQHQRAGTLSGGQKQRLSIAAATLHQPQLLFLDEPTSAVDPQSRRDFWEILFALIADGTTILVSTHYMDEAERCHRLAILDQGTVRADGSPLELYRAMDATVVEIETDNPRVAREALADSENILSVTQLGVRIRVLVAKSIANPTDLVNAKLQQAGISAAAHITHPGLEDVFVMATRQPQQIS